MQRRLMANWFVLTVNIFLLGSLLATWLVRSDRSAAVAGSDARTLGMDVYCAKEPFAVLVNKDFPRDRGFAVLRQDPPLFLGCEDMTDPQKGGQAIQDVTLGMGENFSVSCVYSVGNNGVRVDELLVTRNDAGRIESFSDLNADGFPDLRLTVDPAQDLHRSEIWYSGKWQEAIAQGKKYEKQLPGGETVRFDRPRGLWVLAGEPKDDGLMEGTQETQTPKR